MKKVFLLPAILLALVSQVKADEVPSDSLSQIQLEEVIVSATRVGTNTPVTHSNISKDAISERNSGQDIPYILLLEPSVIVTSDAGAGIGYTNFRVRGTDANRINISINGVPLNDSESHGAFFVNMPDFASSLSSIQIQRGVGTSTTGAATFGASVNMQTENVSRIPYAEISSSYGSFNTHRNTLKAGTGLIGNHFAIDGRYSTIASDGYVDRASVDMHSYYLSGAYLSDNTILKFVTFGGKQKTYLAWNGVDLDLVRRDPLNYTRTYNEMGQYIDDDGNVQFYDNQTDNYTQTHYQLHATHQFSPSLYMNAALHYTAGKGYYEEYRTGRKYVEYLLTPVVENGEERKKTDLIRQKWLDNDFYGATFALNYTQDRFGLIFGGGANNYDGNHFGKVLWVRHPNKNFDSDKDWYRNTGEKTDANIYLKLNVEPVRNLLIYADAQYRYIKYDMQGRDDKFDETENAMRDITQRHTFSFFNPKVGTTYRLDNHNHLYASFSVANREPNRNNYTDAGPNEHPTSERLYDTEVGYRYQSSIASFGANVYYMKYKNQLILTGKISEIGEILTSNIPDSYRTGVELTGGVQISPLLRWDANITFSQNKIKNFVEQDVAVYDENEEWIEARSNELGTTDIAYSPDIVANSILSFSYRGFEIALHSNYVGRQYLDNTSSKERSIDAYFVNNLRASYSFKIPHVESVVLGVWVNNLFNVEYETNGYNYDSYYLNGKRVNEKRYFPQAGTNALANITIRF
ncbi:TonB-dependent receptor [Proteiniphilum sp.]|uniref:TonB-dependent receptor n=1 Tax=Proteiniphilum sp. TaxID=1926877 RepID=UPI002B20786C|nr:TonB-dependent receptor [Proteiniphilum sp.]MEA4917672.1 TonB-dependent receptor [Proteiniphilum sp.]